MFECCDSGGPGSGGGLAGDGSWPLPELPFPCYGYGSHLWYSGGLCACGRQGWWHPVQKKL